MKDDERELRQEQRMNGQLSAGAMGGQWAGE